MIVGYGIGVQSTVSYSSYTFVLQGTGFVNRVRCTIQVKHCYCRVQDWCTEYGVLFKLNTVIAGYGIGVQSTVYYSS